MGRDKVVMELDEVERTLRLNNNAWQSPAGQGAKTWRRVRLSRSMWEVLICCPAPIASFQRRGLGSHGSRHMAQQFSLVFK